MLLGGASRGAEGGRGGLVKGLGALQMLSRLNDEKRGLRGGGGGGVHKHTCTVSTCKRSLVASALWSVTGSA